MTSISTAAELYYLFGFPIAHSVSPAFHNYIFDKLHLQRTYCLAPTTRIDEHIRKLCMTQDFGGASVTMPLKVSISQMLDRTTDEAHTIGAVNTIVPERDEQGVRHLVGTNTDWIGVRNALLHAWLASARDFTFSTKPAAALVIGGGGAARAAVYALASLHCAPVYLVGRDARELAAVAAQFPHVQCIPVSDPVQAPSVAVAVSCIPAIAPVSPEEHAADACVRKIVTSPLTHADKCQRIFLDMCYKPRKTPLMIHAESAGWSTVSGIEVVLEQGFAQARMWLVKSAAAASCQELIPRCIEDGARELIRIMPDVVIESGEERLSDDGGKEQHVKTTL